MSPTEVSEGRTGITKQAVEQITGNTHEAMANYFTWLQETMSACPWYDADFNKWLISCASETLVSSFGLVQKLSQAKNLEDIVRIQTEFANVQAASLNEYAQELTEIYGRMADAAMKMLGAPIRLGLYRMYRQYT